MIVIGHRGACGYRPEHTLESYRLAAEQGATHIEPDLVITRDGVLVARHEHEISGTTDIARRPEFADRRATRGGVTGWFTEDLTLAEIKTLRATERIPDLRPASAAYDGRFEVPTFDEILELRARLSADLGREVGVYPETKHPSHFRELGLPLEEPLVDALARHGLDRAGEVVFVQSFEDNLRRFAGRLAVPLVRLIGLRSPQLAAPEGLREIATYADAVGPAKELIVPRGEDGRSAAVTSLVDDAHAAGLDVHPYTFRRENAFLPVELRSSGDRGEPGDLEAEIRLFADAGIDGLFTDNPDIAVAALSAA